MPIKINSETESVIGAVLYEEYGSDDLQLEFFTSTLKELEKLKDNEMPEYDYPQRPLAQTWIVDYPLLAYKSFTPENKEICIVHMA